MTMLGMIFVISCLASLAAETPGTAPANQVWNKNQASNTAASASSLNPIATETGRIKLSIDALGVIDFTYSDNTVGIIQAEKPVGGTVRRAFFFSATTGFTNYRLNPGDVKLDGVDVLWTSEIPSSISSYNYSADVTDIVKAKLDAAPAGRVDFTVRETNPGAIYGLDPIDGEILAVIFNDPNQSKDVTVILLFGAQDIAGDQFYIGLAQPLDLTDPSTLVQMSLGISFGYQDPSTTNQVSLIDVNNVRLTSSAGGQDDGVAANGALITAGGLDDNPANPPDPYAAPTNFNYDDELYDLRSLVNTGDLLINVHTSNPSNDDNMFFGAFYLSAAAIVGEGCVLTPSEATNPVGTAHTVTATVQDEFGGRLEGRVIQFQITGGVNAVQGVVDTTDVNGQAFYTYTGNVAGVDTIHAWFTNSQGAQQEAQNYSIKTWTRSETENGGICGYASYNGIGANGINFTVFNENGDIIETDYTDNSGNINFDNLPNGDYTVEIETPLGFKVYPEASQLVTVNGYPCVTATFELIPNATGKIHDIWWWKAQLQYIRDKKPSVISMANVNAFCQAIYKRFYLRDDGYAIQIENITYAPGPEALDFYDVLNVMVTLAADNSNKAGAARNLLANLLNIAAGYQSQLALVSVDGATASQAVTYFAGLYNLGGNAAYNSVHINLIHCDQSRFPIANINQLSFPPPDIMDLSGSSGNQFKRG